MTDRGIPTELKTGFNLLEPEDPTENIASIVLVFMENAVKSADIYVKHAKRNSSSFRRQPSGNIRVRIKTYP